MHSDEFSSQTIRSPIYTLKNISEVSQSIVREHNISWTFRDLLELWFVRN
jgi:hypothetical protein